jgi:hypothetical protein
MSKESEMMSRFYVIFHINKSNKYYAGIYESCRDLSGSMSYLTSFKPEATRLLGEMLAFLVVNGQRLPNLTGYFS